MEMNLVDIKEDVINHLKGVSNQNAIVHFGDKSMSISELSNEVLNETEIGTLYSYHWFKVTEWLKK